MLVELSEVICPKRSVWLNEPLGKDFRPIMAIFYLPDDASKCKHDPTKQLRLDIYIYIWCCFYVHSFQLGEIDPIWLIKTTYFSSQATRDRAAAPRGTVAPPSGAPGAPQGPRATVVGGTRASQLGALRMEWGAEDGARWGKQMMLHSNYCEDEFIKGWYLENLESIIFSWWSFLRR